MQSEMKSGTETMENSSAFSTFVFHDDMTKSHKLTLKNIWKEELDP